MTIATQDTGATNEVTGPLNEDEAAEALLARFLPPDEGEDASKKKPSSTKKTDDEESGTTKDEAEEKPAAEKPEGSEEAEATEEDAEDGDGETAFVKIKVGEEEHEVPVSKLTRLYGQEAALTKKSMEVAEQRKAYEGKLAEQAATTNAIFDRALERYEPYSKIDFNLLATQVSAEEYQALRQAAQTAYEDVVFLQKHTGDFMAQLNERRTTATHAQAKEAIKVLSGPADKGGIDGWNQKLYDDIRAYAVTQGAPSDVINSVVDPWAIKMMHSAMLFARGQSKSKSAVTVTKVNNTPKKIVKTTTSPAVGRSSSAAGAQKAMAKLQETGSQDDAAEALLARWVANSGD